MSQPSLSTQLAQVEEALGVRLFERSRKAVLLTASGKELVERSRRLLREADELVRAAQRVGDPLSGTIRLGVIPTVSPYLLPAVTPALRRRLARLRIAWLEEKTDVLVRRLGEGRIEGALVALEACSSARAREGEFRATSLSTLVQMVAGGAGITLIPALAVDAEARRARLHVRPLKGPSAHRTVALVWRKGSSMEPALRAIADVLRDAYPARATRPTSSASSTSRRPPSARR